MQQKAFSLPQPSLDDRGEALALRLEFRVRACNRAAAPDDSRRALGGRVSRDLSPQAAIRPTTSGDLAALKVIVEAVDLFPSELLDDMTAPFLAGSVQEQRWLTADVDGAPAAVAYYVAERMTHGTWNLLLIAVHPDWQGRGIGAALMHQVETELATAGARILLVETSGLPAFAGTRRFYRRIGYEEEACIRGFYAIDDDKVIFSKALARSAVAVAPFV